MKDHFIPDELLYIFFKNLTNKPKYFRRVVRIIWNEYEINRTREVEYDAMMLLPLSFVCKRFRRLVMEFMGHRLYSEYSKIKLEFESVACVFCFIGDIELVRWGKELFGKSNSCFGDEKLFSMAILGGNFKLVNYLSQFDFKTNQESCSDAALSGDLDTLKWLKSQKNCYWDEKTCRSAAENGHLNVLMWLKENGCPWNNSTCFFAALYGHLDVLIWAREQGCPWDKTLYYFAAHDSHLDVLQWAYDNGLVDEKMFQQISENSDFSDTTKKWFNDKLPKKTPV